MYPNKEQLKERLSLLDKQLQTLYLEEDNLLQNIHKIEKEKEIIHKLLELEEN